MDLGIDQDARAGIADFALVAIDAVDGVLRGHVEVRRVPGHDLRSLAAAFRGDALHVGLAGIDHHQLADFGGAGEADLVDIHVKRQRLAGFFSPRA